MTKKKGGKPLENDLPPLCPFDLRDREPAQADAAPLRWVRNEANRSPEPIRCCRCLA